MIGLIFGETNFPIQILKKIKRIGLRYLIIDLTSSRKFRKNRNYLRGINLIGLKRKKYENKKIMELDAAFKKIFSSKNLHESLNKINGEYKGNDLVAEVIKFIAKDKKRPICTPHSE